MICNTSLYIFQYFQTPFAHNPFLPCIYNSGNDTTWRTAVCFWPFSPLVLLKVHDMHWFWKEEVKTCELVYYLRKYVPLRKTKMSKLTTCMLGKQKTVKKYIKNNTAFLEMISTHCQLRQVREVVTTSCIQAQNNVTWIDCLIRLFP